MFHNGTRVRRAAIAALLVLATSTANGAGRVFYDSAESGSDPISHGWSPDSPNGLCSYVTSGADGTTPHSGSKMIRCNFSNMASNAYDTLKVGTSNYNDEFLYRAFVRLDTNYQQDGTVSQKIFRHFQTNPYHDHFAVIGPADADYTDNCNPNDTAGCATKYLGNCLEITGAWHKYEFYLRQSTGTIKVWCDDVLVRNDTGMDFVSTKWTTFYLTSNGHIGATDAVNYQYYDDFEIFSDQGSGATGSMSDATITQSAAGGVAPTITAVSCSPTLNQAPSATNCSASATGDAPITWAWTGAGANCSFGTPTAASTTLTCSYGGARTPCVTANNSAGSSGPSCVATNSVVWRYRKPTSFGAN